MNPSAIIVRPDRLDEIEQAQRDAFTAFAKGRNAVGQAYLLTAIDLLNQLRGRV